LDDADEVLMRDDVTRAGLRHTRNKKERRNERERERETKKVRRTRKTKRTLVLLLRKDVVVVGRATGTREVDNENIFLLLFCADRQTKKIKKEEIFSLLTNRFFRRTTVVARPIIESFDDDM